MRIGRAPRDRIENLRKMRIGGFFGMTIDTAGPVICAWPMRPRERTPSPVFGPIPESSHCSQQSYMRTISKKPWSFLSQVSVDATCD